MLPTQLPVVNPQPMAAPAAPVHGSPKMYMGVSDEQGMRNYMEDRHMLIPDFAIKGASDNTPRQFAAVYDGHSSSKGSTMASHRLHQIISEMDEIKACRGNPFDKEEPILCTNALKKAFLAADEEIIADAKKRNTRFGTTAVVALRVGSVVYIAHAGDSRAVLCRSIANHTQHLATILTQDHKPASVPAEKERIQVQGGKVSDASDRVYSNPESGKISRLNMSRALGDYPHKSPRPLITSEPDVMRVLLQKNNDRFIVLGTDGLFDVLKNHDVVDLVLMTVTQFVAEAGEGALSDDLAATCADVLVKQALMRGTNDNVTAAVLLFDWSKEEQ